MDNKYLLNFQDYDNRSLSSNPQDTMPTDSTVKSGSPFKFEFYQKLFDIESEDVIKRLKYSLLPLPNNLQFLNFKENPDLYGPFWICVTLSIALSIFENIGTYLRLYGKTTDPTLFSDFGKMPSAALLLFIYGFGVPTILYLFLKFRNRSSIDLQYVELLCIYGYALAIFIPMTFFCMINHSWIQWIALLICGTFSFGFIFQYVWKSLTEFSATAQMQDLTGSETPTVGASKKFQSLILIGVLGLLHLIFMFCLKHFFMG